MSRVAHQYEIDKKLGIKSTDDVEAMGIRKYNEECRSIVTRYCEQWETIVTRLGRWIDFKNDYKTMEPWVRVLKPARLRLGRWHG